jgi:hypothetical protein
LTYLISAASERSQRAYARITRFDVVGQLLLAPFKKRQLTG